MHGDPYCRVASPPPRRTGSLAVAAAIAGGVCRVAAFGHPPSFFPRCRSEEWPRTRWTHPPPGVGGWRRDGLREGAGHAWHWERGVVGYGGLRAIGRRALLWVYVCIRWLSGPLASPLTMQKFVDRASSPVSRPPFRHRTGRERRATGIWCAGRLMHPRWLARGRGGGGRRVWRCEDAWAAMSWRERAWVAGCTCLTDVAGMGRCQWV